MALAIVIILLVIGSVIFHFVSPWWFTPIASNWGSINDTITLTFWVTGAVFIAVNLFMAYAIIKYRHKPQSRSHYEPENKKLEWWLTGITALGVIAMLAPGLFVWDKFINVPEGAMEVEALGKQWHWSFRYPGDDNILGLSAVKFINPNNPFGLDPDDPNGADDLLVNGPEAHVPIDRPVNFLLRSTDVLHDFAVPQFRVKMDLVPGIVSYVWLTPERIGSYELLCEELCGVGHHTMRGRVVVESQENFDQWLGRLSTFETHSARGPGDPAVGASLYAVCATCHGPEGTGNKELNAPKIAGLGSWYISRQLSNFKQGHRAYHEDDLYGKQMAPMAAILIDDKAIANVAAYIGTLPDHPSKPTMEGDSKDGKSLYTTCAVCHGNDGMGRQATNAPRLAGVDDWYIARQLYNFKDGIRGAHRDDIYGFQMTTMAPFLTADPDSINNLVAYINTL